MEKHFEKNTDKNEVTLWQDNLLTVARYDMTALEKNILYMVMSQIRKDDTFGTFYYVSAREIMERVGERIDFIAFKKATKMLIGRVFETTLPNGNLLQSSFVASAEYLAGEGIIKIEVSRQVLPFYLELKEKFTTFQLDAALALNSKYAKRLYEMLSMYKAMPSRSFTISLIELKKLLHVIDAKNKDSYPSFTDFSNRVLIPAEREINEGTDIKFTYQVILGENKGRGRKPVSSIKFLVNSKNTPLLPQTVHSDVLLKRLTTEFGLNKTQAQRVINENEAKIILKKLYDISLVKNTIRNIGGYTAKSFGV
jgi:plasmid replication initiation protein